MMVREVQSSTACTLNFLLLRFASQYRNSFLNFSTPVDDFMN